MKVFTIALIVLSLLFPSAGAWAMGKRPEAEVVEPKVQRTVTLMDCYDLALRRSDTLAITREEIEKTKAAYLAAAGEALGDVDFVITDFQQPQRSTGSGSDGSSVGSTLTATERRERKFTISQPLFQGFKSLGAIAGAGSLRKQRGNEFLRSKELLFLDVVSAFYDVLLQQKNLENTEGIRELLEERISDLKEREKIGRSRSSEVVTAVTSLRLLEADLEKTRGSLGNAWNMLSFLTGLAPDEMKLDDQVEPQKKMPEELSEYLKKITVRPDVEASRQAMKTAWQDVIIKQSDLWPAITLDSNVYEKREGFQGDINWDVLFKIDVPLFKGGETAGAVKEAWSNYKQAKHNYSLTKRQAELDIRNSYQDWATSVQQHRALEQALKSTEENYRIQKQEYGLNLVNNLDVIEALRTLFETSKNTNGAYYEMKQNQERLRVAVGEFR